MTDSPTATASPTRDPAVTIDVPVITRVEGEGALHVRLDGDRVEDVRLEIYEPPRLFEGILRGRGYEEPLDITARICGICPVAYQLTAASALERICAVELDPELAALRRVAYCGEWIESHVLHVVLLHAPDFLGLPSGFEIAAADPDRVRRFLALKRAGNRVVEVLGGRPIHPVNVRLGGWYSAPSAESLRTLLTELRDARRHAVELVEWTAGLVADDRSHHVGAVGDELLSLRGEGGYPIERGRIVTDRGLDVDADELDGLIDEHQVEHSNALHARLRGRPGDGRYRVGPLARWANNHDLLPAAVADLADDVGVGARVDDPARSIVVRSLETLFALDEAIRLLERTDRPTRPFVPTAPRAGRAAAVTEAPRGTLLHRYELAADGTIVDVRIVPPTSQNQAAIESDVRRRVERAVRAGEHRSDGGLQAMTRSCEAVVRHHDPCISCATHFLRLDLERV